MACRDWAAKVGGGVLGRVWALVAALALLLGLAATAPAPAQAASFRDVPSGQWYTSWVDKASDQGLMSGFTDPATGRPTGYFGPDEPLTRAQVATVLWRMAGGPSSGRASFPDVERGSWYDAPVAWCVKAGVVTGYTSGPDRGCFRPDRPVTRQELATMVHRYAKYAGMDVADPDPMAFRSTTDWRTVDTWASEALTWTAAAGVLSGVDNHDGTYSVVPFGTATRAMAAKVFVVLSGSPSPAKATYTVTFDPNGGSAVKAQTVRSGAKASKPTSPTKSGYTFKGWYSDKSLTKAYDFNSTVRSNLTLHAKWEAMAATYTVTFNSNGGSSVKAQTVAAGSRAAIPAAPTRPGYAFTGWYTSKSATQYKDGSYRADSRGIGGKVPVTVVVSGGRVSEVCVGDNAETCGIGSIAIGRIPGEIVRQNGTDNVDVVSGATVTSKAIVAAVGECLAKAGRDEVYDFACAVNDDTTLYAGWVKAGFVVSFDGNGSPCGSAQFVLPGSKAVVPSDPVRSDGTFTYSGWYADSKLTNRYDFSVPVTADLTLYAKWDSQTQLYAVLYSDGLLSLQKGSDEDADHGTVLGKWEWDASLRPWYDKRARVRSVAVRDGLIIKSGSFLFSDLANCQSMDLSKFDTSKVTNFDSMFSNCQKLETVKLDGWNLSHATNLSNMFYGCASLESLDVSNWDVSNVRLFSMTFYGCRSLTDVDVTDWDISGAENLYLMFDGCSSLKSLDLSHWDVSEVNTFCSGLSGMFTGCRSLTSLNLSGWDLSNTSNLSYMFDACSSLASLDVSDWNLSSATDISHMFRGCRSLCALDLSSWDVSNVISFSSMFSDCPLLSSVSLGTGCGPLVSELPSGPWYDAVGNEYSTVPAGVAGTFTKTKPVALAVAADAVSGADALPLAQIVEGVRDGLRYVVVPEGAPFEYGLEYPELAGCYVGPGVYVTGYVGESDSLVVPLEVVGMSVVSANLSWNDSDRADMTRLVAVSFERVEGKVSSLAQLDVSGNALSSLDIEGLGVLVRLNCEGNPIADLAQLQAWAAVEGHEARLSQVQEAVPGQSAAGDNAQVPSEPQESASPDVPTKPAEPANPETSSAEPEGPSDPAVPSEPEQPGSSDVSGKPDQPGDDSVGSDMGESDEQEEPADTAGLGEAGQDGDASASEEQAGAVELAEPGEEPLALAA